MRVLKGLQGMCGVAWQERIAMAHGSQCGFCTPGFVMSMYSLLRNNLTPSDEDIEDAFQGTSQKIDICINILFR